jgi:hypothetical protein
MMTVPLLLAPPRVWTPISLRTAADRAAGRAGSEGGQVILGLAADASGGFLLMGVDVAGIYRLLDGGKT